MRKIIYVIALAATLITQGCFSTVTPKRVIAKEASFDGNSQTSGEIRFSDGSLLITTNARDRYNALIDLYGNTFTPPIKRDFGVTSGPFEDQPMYWMTKAAIEKFAEMTMMKNQGR